MGAIRNLARRAAARVARVVARDDLFEKPGERPATPPLPEPVAAKSEPKAAPPKSAPPPAAPKAAPPKSVAPAPAAGSDAPAPTSGPLRYAWPGVKARRPTEGCAPVGVDGLKAALTPDGRPLVINHWATWCDPCVDELPRLVRAAAGAADVGEFLGVSWDLFDHPGKPALVAKKVGKFADSAGVGYPSVLFTGAPEELFALCGLDVQLVPQTLVVARDGRVVWHKKGVVDHDDVFPLIEAIKAAST